MIRKKSVTSKRHIPRVLFDSKITSGSNIFIKGEKYNHLVKVLRLKLGSDVKVFNSEDGEFNASITHLTRDSIILEVSDQLRVSTTTRPINLYIGITKPATMADIVTKTTELGVTTIQPIISEFCHYQTINLAKLNKVAISATEQCGRLDVPDIKTPITLTDLLASDVKLNIADQSGASLTKAHAPNWLIGPEGGLAIRNWHFLMIASTANTNSPLIFYAQKLLLLWLLG